MKRNLIFLINPVSGTSGKTAVKEMICKRCESAKLSFKIIDTNKEGDYAFLRDLVLNENVTDMIVCGGDGSVSQVASHLLNLNVNIGIIPMGSGNGLAYAASIPSGINKALDIIVAGKAAYIDAFMINNKFSCMLCGIGFDAQVAHDFARQKSRGLFTYVKMTLKNFFNAASYPFEVILDSTSFSANCYFISIANSNQFGNNFTIAPQASLSDGFLDIILVKKMNKLKMIFSILAHVKFGRVAPADDPADKTDILYYRTKNLLIRNHGDAPLHIDGEPAQTSRELKVSIIEKAIRLLQP